MMSEAERQVEGLFESLIMDTFRVSLKERIDSKRGKNLYRVTDDGSPVLATSFIHLDLSGKTVSFSHIR